MGKKLNAKQAAIAANVSMRTISTWVNRADNPLPVKRIHISGSPRELEIDSDDLERIVGRPLRLPTATMRLDSLPALPASPLLRELEDDEPDKDEMIRQLQREVSLLKERLQTLQVGQVGQATTRETLVREFTPRAQYGSVPGVEYKRIVLQHVNRLPAGSVSFREFCLAHKMSEPKIRNYLRESRFPIIEIDKHTGNSSKFYLSPEIMIQWIRIWDEAGFTYDRCRDNIVPGWVASACPCHKQHAPDEGPDE